MLATNQVSLCIEKGTDSTVIPLTYFAVCVGHVWTHTYDVVRPGQGLRLEVLGRLNMQWQQWGKDSKHEKVVAFCTDHPQSTNQGETSGTACSISKVYSPVKYLISFNKLLLLRCKKKQTYKFNNVHQTACQVSVSHICTDLMMYCFLYLQFCNSPPQLKTNKILVIYLTSSHWAGGVRCHGPSPCTPMDSSPMSSCVSSGRVPVPPQTMCLSPVGQGQQFKSATHVCNKTNTMRQCFGGREDGKSHLGVKTLQVKDPVMFLWNDGVWAGHVQSEAPLHQIHVTNRV